MSRKVPCTIICFAIYACVFAQAKKFTVTAYYARDTVQINKYDPTKLTHIIYSFCHLKNNRLWVNNRMDTFRIQKLVSLKQKNPALKVLLSLGGWGGCATCSEVFSTDAGRKEFASSVRETNNYFGTDGIDLDWEYPVVEGYPGHKYQPQDKQNFTALVKTLRDSIGTKNEISFAAGGFQKFIDDAIDWQQVMPLVDRINLMSYDLVSGYATVTGHHTPLYSTSQQKESAHNAIEALIKKGVPASKIVIGAAFYGRVWENVPLTNNGIYQTGKFKASIDFANFENGWTEKSGFVKYWDDVAKAPYMYNSTTKLFMTYDDKRSMTEKTKYVIERGLNGIMFWELSHDLAKDGLLDAINDVRNIK